MVGRFASIQAAALVAWLLATAPAAAHHGWGGNAAEIVLAGVVETGVSLSGPHGTLQIRDADGQLWQITLAPAPRTHRAGLREDTIPVGAEVTVHGQRNADPATREIKVRRVTWQGQHYDVYPPPAN
jgi:hypothetical protein